MQAGYTPSKEKYQKVQIWILVRKKTVAKMRPVSSAKVNNQNLDYIYICPPGGWRALLSHIKKTIIRCGTPSGRRAFWSCWKWFLIMVENRGTRRQWGILLLLPRCQNKLRIHCLFNSVSSLFLQLLPQEQIGSPSVMTFITLLVGIVNHFECLWDTFRFL